MKAPSQFGSYRPREKGVALVLTLAILVIATIIVTAFFFRSRFDSQGSGSYSSLVSSQKLAELGASQAIAGVLAEARAGSVPVGAGDTLKLKPKSSIYMVLRGNQPDDAQRFRSMPAPVNARDDSYANVVRQSIKNLENADIEGTNVSGGIEVSNVSTLDAALNRAGLTGKFWGKPFLTAAPVSESNGFEDEFVPNWVYVAADGLTTNATPTNQTQREDSPRRIVGRYAFNVYDVGGLLDINAAGFNSQVAEIANRKGSLVFADLRGLGNSIGVPLDETFVTELNAWRYEPMNWQPTASQPNPQLSLLLKSAPMFASLGKYPVGLSDTAGFAGGRVNRNAFLSRNDLIRYFAERLDNGNGLDKTRQILPYLTHFTRDINAPTMLWNWDSLPRPRPSTTRSSVSEVEATKINSDVWTDDGTSLMPKRFALDKLDLLQLNEAGTALKNSSAASLINKYFGLTWQGSFDPPAWEYDQSKVKTSSTGQPRFRTLEEVHAAGDTPNFFEVLQAAIYCGSLGGQLAGVTPYLNPVPRPSVTDSGNNDPYYNQTPNNRPHAFNRDDSSIGMHVARIAAAIIDQWDEDSLPTTIRFAKRTVFGVEDLPYLHGFRRCNYFLTGPRYQIKPAAGKDGPTFDVVSGATMLHPQVWNPHVQPTGPLPTSRPTKFRVVPYTTTIAPDDPPTNQPNFAYGTDFGRPNLWPVQHDSANGGVNFQDPNVLARWNTSGIPATLRNLDTYSANGANPLLNQDDDYLEFSLSSGNEVREPMLLWKASNTNSVGTVSLSSSGRGTTKNAVAIDGTLNRAVGSDSTSPRLGFQVGNYYLNVSAVPLVDNPGADRPWAQVDLLRYRGWAEADNRVNFALQYQAPGGGDWRTYDIMYDVVDFYTAKNTMSSVFSIGQDQVWRVPGRDSDVTFRVDPRVERFGPQSQYFKVYGGNFTTTTYNYFPENVTGWDGTKIFTFKQSDGGQDYRFMAYNNFPRQNGAAALTEVKRMWLNYTASTTNTFPGLAANNGSATKASAFHYADPDLQVRFAMAGWGSPRTVKPENPYAMEQNPAAARPIVLNRPFQSVAEMGYACRDLPWKSLDFFNGNSGDAALLDYFCLHESDYDPIDKPTASQLTAGVLNLNSANPYVLSAVIQGVSASKNGDVGEQLIPADADDIADGLSAWVRNAADPKEGPFQSRAEIVGKWSGDRYVGPFTGVYALNNAASISSPVSTANSTMLYRAMDSAAAKNPARFDSRRTSIMRALVDSSTVRTWNLMIDVVAQSGKIRLNGDLEDFVVEGQSRYWVFVAIDRFTGKIIDKRVESAD